MASEPEIFINGTLLSEGAAMTIRVALESFYSDLDNMGLGDDKLGREIRNGYKKQIKLLRSLYIKDYPKE